MIRFAHLIWLTFIVTFAMQKDIKMVVTMVAIMGLTEFAHWAHKRENKPN